MLSGMGIVILKKLRNNLKIKIFMRKCVNDPGPFVSTTHKAIEKSRKRCDLNADKVKYFMMQEPKFSRIHLFPKIYKRLHHVSGQPVISTVI